MRIVVHGGAGAIAPARFERLRAGVRAAAEAGHAILAAGGSALDAVVAAVRVLEDDPEFGAGVGSALTRAGNVETCAAVMDGTKRRAGSCVTSRLQTMWRCFSTSDVTATCSSRHASMRSTAWLD